jgi:hypothetical protein
MNEYRTGFFVTTTGEDQQNYFFGAIQPGVHAWGGKERSFLPGNYRVIDGQLCLVISGLSTEDVRNRLLLASQVDS